MRLIMIYYNHTLDKKIFIYIVLIPMHLELSLNTKDFIKDLKNSEDNFDFSNLDKNHELFSNKNKKGIGLFKNETLKNIWIDEFVCLRSKMYAFKFGDDSKKKLKGISKSQSKNIKFEEYYNCLFGEKHQQECDNYIIRSINHEIYLQRVKKPILSQFDDKRCFKKIMKVYRGISTIKWL